MGIVMPSILQLLLTFWYPMKKRFDDALGKRECIKKWRVIGYQNMATDEFPSGECKKECDAEQKAAIMGDVDTHPVLCNLACKVEVGSSLLHLGSEARFERFRMLGDAVDQAEFVRSNMDGVDEGRITKLNKRLIKVEVESFKRQCHAPYLSNPLCFQPLMFPKFPLRFHVLEFSGALD